MSWAFCIDSVALSKATRDGLTSLGGSESACLGLARALKARGHDVHVYATKLAPDAEGRDRFGVKWHRAEDFSQMNQFIEWDVVVALRQSHWFGPGVQARLRLLWNQDMLMPGWGAGIMAIAWALDGLVYVSEYQRQQWEGEQKELAPLGWVTKNGFDTTCVPKDAIKDPTRIIHITRPERGLESLLEMWPAFKQQAPEATLQICRYESMYDSEGSTAREICLAADRRVEQLNAQVGGVTYLGTLNKPQLYQAIAEAALMWYPGVKDFAETSCIAAIEAQACGTPFLGSLKGALPETAWPAFEAGLLLPGDAMDPAYQTASIAAAAQLLDACKRNSFDYRKLQQAGRAHVRTYTYDAIAAEWEAHVEQCFAERYASQKPAIMRQLLHEDDHCAAKVVAAEIQEFHLSHPGSDPDGTNRALALRDEEFCDRVIAGVEQTAEQYAKYAIQDPLKEVELGGRFKAVHPYFKDCLRVLDVACGNGAFAIGLALAYPDLHIYGLDYAAENIAHAIDGAQRAGVAERCHFQALTVYDFDQQDLHTDWLAFVAGVAEPFDGLFVGEFVEHVAACHLLIDGLEAPLSEGARVVYTCPSGPFVELVGPGQYIQKGHVHCFKHDDVRTVFGPKLEAASDFFQLGMTSRGNAIGHWIIHYRVAPNRAAQPRDFALRALRTRPFQRLTVGLIVQNGGLDLAKCLDSIWPVADEIIVGNTGSNDNTAEIAERYGAKVLDLAPVSEQPDGFAGARNEVLQASSGDWFLWIDADEFLLAGYLLRKYLEGATYHGFVIRQHHLQLDAPNNFDIPVRLFRTNQAIQFYGCIHEQPQQGDCNREIYPALEVQDVNIVHGGYLTDDIRRGKMMNRNLPLLIRDEERFPTRVLSKVLRLRDYVNLADMDCERAGGVTAKAQRGYAHAMRLFIDHFSDPTHKFHTVARPFYEIALKRLGVGWELEIALAGKQGGIGPKHARIDRVWVRDAAEAQQLLAFRSQQVVDGMVPKTAHTDPYQVPAAAEVPA